MQHPTYIRRFMGSLRILRLNESIVYAPTLACISHQLEVLDLEGSVLRTGCVRGQPTAFLNGWDQLKRLDLTGVRLDARLGCVMLPQLKELFLEDCCYIGPVLAEGTGEQVGAGAFAGGCPKCESINVNAGAPGTPEGVNSMSCQGFRALQRVRMMVNTVALRKLILEAWPRDLVGPQLPSSVTRLEMLPGRCCEEQVDLYAALHLAAGYICTGVPLAEIVCEECTTMMDSWDVPNGQDFPAEEDEADEYISSTEPDELAYSHQYLPMLRSLRGLTSLDLEASHCCDRMRDEIVSCMPDLTKLAFYLRVDVGREGGQPVRTQPLLCKGLAQMRLTYFPFGVCVNEHAVRFELGYAEKLVKCETVLMGCMARKSAMGAQICFSLDCSSNISLQPWAAKAGDDWNLGFTAMRTEGQPCSSMDGEGCKHAEVTFRWAQGQCSNGSLAGMWQTMVVDTPSTQRLHDQVSAEPSPAEVSAYCYLSWLP
jgi:hypothetical protein